VPSGSTTSSCVRSTLSTSSDFCAPATARESLSMMSRGVPAGATSPNQMLVSKSGMPASAMVGRFGAIEGRLLVAEASPLSLPASTWADTAEIGENMIETRPARRSVAACGLP